MKYIFTHFSIAFWLLLFVFQAATAQKNGKDLMELVAAEHAFARKAEETTIRNAFLANLDNDGILFNGGAPVNGIALYRDAPENPKDLLSWYPVTAYCDDGYMGFTSGPYKYFAERGKDAVGGGHFFSIWKRNGPGTFKLFLDGGVPQPLSEEDFFVRDPKPDTGTHDFGKFNGVNNPKLIRPWDMEKEFEALAEKNAAEAYQKFLGETSLMLRNESIPGRDIHANLQILGRKKIDSYTFTKSGEGISGSYALAYCYGQVQEKITDTNKKKSGFFVRVWQYQKDGWKIIADVVSLH